MSEVHTVGYGAHPAQAGDLYVPRSRARALVCLLHGGFWRAPHGREQLRAVAAHVAARGYQVWNLGYRRVGDAGGGFPGTLHDVDAGMNVLERPDRFPTAVAVRTLIVVGHSAGAQLALWSVARSSERIPGISGRVRPIAAAALGPLCDLRMAWQAGAGGGAVDAFVGGSPAAEPARYDALSPRALLPLQVPQLVVQGTADDTVPPDATRDYVRAAREAGDLVEHHAPAGATHMDALDPRGDTVRLLVDWLDRLTGSPGGPA